MVLLPQRTMKTDFSTDMEFLKDERKALRTTAERLVDEAEALLKPCAPNGEELEVIIERLQLTHRQLNDVDAAIEPLIFEQEADTQFATITLYGDEIVTSLSKLKSAVKSSRDETKVDSTNPNEDGTRMTGMTVKIKLPELGLTKLDGEKKKLAAIFRPIQNSDR
ncbi:hypothetical protein V5799_030995 [Amblyomma americanum]|uniref:Uncharacterized protein n=1 Tax=Amblyomma americanum TaxID=6943 RepID=A0AAQ4ELK1_AMBAM